MIAHRSNASLRLLPAALLTALCGACSGPDLVVEPSFAPTAELPRADEKIPVALRLRSFRTRGPARESGGEILDKGQKGSVLIDRGYEDFVRDDLVGALRSAGFELAEDAEIRVDVQLVDFALEADQFTEWDYDEDAQIIPFLEPLVRLFLPGPTRPTSVKSTMDVVVTKGDRIVAKSDPIIRESTVESRDSDVVAELLGDVHSQTLEAVVRETVGGVNLARRLPVSAADFREREALLAQREAEVDRAREELAAHRGRLDGTATELEQERSRVRQQSEKLRQDLARAEEAFAAARQENTDLTRRLERLTADARSAQGERKAEIEREVARLRSESETLATRLRETEDARATLAAEAAELDERARTLEARERRLEQRQRELERDLDDLRQLELEVARRESRLQELAKQPKDEAPAPELASAVATVRPPDILLLERPVSVTTLERVDVEGVVVGDAEIAACRYSVNDGPLRDAVSLAGRANAEVGTRGPGAPVRAPRSEGAEGGRRDFLEFRLTTDLALGENRIRIEAEDREGTRSTPLELLVHREEPTGEVHLLAIGIDSYKHAAEADGRIPDLRFAVADARAVHETFTRGLGVPPQNAVLLSNEEAGNTEIQIKLRELLGRTDEGDTVVVYFSGHGTPDRVATRGATGAAAIEKYLLPWDAKPGYLDESAISMTLLADRLERLNSHRLIFFADTCYSGAVVEGAKTARLSDFSLVDGEFRGIELASIDDSLKKRGRVILTAAKANELAQEKRALGHGVFTYYLVRGLEGRADGNRDGQVTISELYDFVATGVRRETNGQQTPQMSVDSELAGRISFRARAKQN